MKLIIKIYSVYIVLLEHHIKAWDSDFFGFRVGEASISRFTSEAHEYLMNQIIKSGYRLVYILPGDKNSFEVLMECKITHIDTKITFVKEINKNFLHEENVFITKYVADNSFDELVDLALTSGVYSRFKKDLHFEKGTFESLYKTWISRSINHEIADEVLVYKSDKTIQGFVSYSELDGQKVIGLIAVDSKSSNKGIGKSLLMAVENAASNDGCNKVYVSTQSENYGACRFYSACGYHINNKQPIFHLWI